MKENEMAKFLMAIVFALGISSAGFACSFYDTLGDHGIKYSLVYETIAQSLAEFEAPDYKAWDMDGTRQSIQPAFSFSASHEKRMALIKRISDHVKVLSEDQVTITEVTDDILKSPNKMGVKEYFSVRRDHKVFYLIFTQQWNAIRRIPDEEIKRGILTQGQDASRLGDFVSRSQT